MAKLFNRAKMDTTTTGSGTITLGSAVDGYQTFADAGVADSDVVQYVIEDGTSWEIGTGTYSATGTSLTRTPSESSNAGAAISLTGAAEVFITAVADDLNRLQNAGSDIVTVSASGAAVTGDLTTSGDLTVNGVVAADLSFGDNDKATFGAGSDLQIYHNGSNSYIQEIGTGNLFVASDANVNITNQATSELKATFISNGAVNLYYDNSKKLATTSTGVDVTGNIAVSGTVDGRDIASDGSKLDGIESGATADQTAAEIRTLVESATDSNVFTDADHTKLDGIESGATADQTKADIDALGVAASTASTLATARNIALTGAVTGNANFDGSSNISIATTATSDPTLTLSGDVSGSATFTNLGNATLSATVADDSHNHIIANVDGLQTALDGKLSTSGKAADSDLLDGINSGSFLRSDATDTFTNLSGTSLDVSGELEGQYIGVGNSSNTSGYGISLYSGGVAGQPTFGLMFSGTATYGTHGQVNGDWATYFTMNNTSGRGWIFRDVSSGTNVASIENTGYATFPRIYLNDTIYHNGDTDTYLNFGTNTITLATGGSSEITVNTTGVRLGDTGNGYFQPVSGDYGSIQIDGGAHNGYEGYSIGGRVVLMHDNSSVSGLYNDVNNEWLFRADLNGSTFLYNNGVQKVQIGASYMEMSQHLDMNNYDIYGCDQIFHHGDTNTYMQFHTSDQWRVVAGGTERLEVTNGTITVNGTLNNTSDERLKENIQPIKNALSDVAQLEGVSFDWKDTGIRGHGFIAQQIETVIPEVVDTDEETGIKSVNYVGVIGHLVEAIKELKAEIEELKS